MIKLSDVKVRPQYRTRVRYRLVVLEYAWEHGPAAARRHYRLSARTIRRWRKRWRRGGVEGCRPFRLLVHVRAAEPSNGGPDLSRASHPGGWHGRPSLPPRRTPAHARAGADRPGS